MPQILNDPDHRYLSIQLDFQLRDFFELRMLEENRIDGLLPLQVCDDNGTLTLNYDITGKDTLASLAGSKKLLASDIRQLILTLKHVVNGLPPYLLDPSAIALSMDSVYASPVSRSPCFLYVPGKSNSFAEALSDFLQALLSYADHDDYPSVVLAYRLYKESLDHPSALDRLEQILISQETPFGQPVVSSSQTAPIDISSSEALHTPENDPLVSEIREVALADSSSEHDTAEHNHGLFRKLFRKNEEKKECLSPEDEEKQWMEILSKN